RCCCGRCWRRRRRLPTANWRLEDQKIAAFGSYQVQLLMLTHCPHHAFTNTASALSHPTAVDIFTGQRVKAPAAAVEIQ
ncbi:MAG: hypothetical protein ABWY46_11295, partial [Pseudomonas sp.]